MALVGCSVISIFIAGFIYPNIEVKNQPSNRSCTGMCYAMQVERNGTVVDILRAQQAAALGDPFSDILVNKSINNIKSLNSSHVRINLEILNIP